MIRLDADGGIAWLRLDRPQARNALAMADWEDLAQYAEEVRRSEARLLIVVGEGNCFCAGADLGEFGELQASEAARRRFRTSMRAALDGLAGLPIPTIASIEGACYGAGVALAMACDIRFAAPEARFAITPARIGIGYPQEDVHRLVSLVGPGEAARLLRELERFKGDDPLNYRTAALVDGRAQLQAEIDRYSGEDGLQKFRDDKNADYRAHRPAEAAALAQATQDDP